MIASFLQDRAALYASGALTAEEREEFELVLAFNPELQALTQELTDAGLEVTRSLVPPAEPSRVVRARVLDAIQQTGQTVHCDGLVMSGPDGLVQWINPEFSAMCGYTLDEVRGRKLGPLLQGPETDPAAVDRMRTALRELLPTREIIRNYHKNGTPYWVDIAITPIFNDAHELCWFVAKERELPNGPAALESGSGR